MFKRMLVISLIFMSISTLGFAQNFQTIDVEQAPQIILNNNKKPSVVIMYSSQCPICQKVWPNFIGVGGDALDKNLNVLAFSTDKVAAYPAQIFRYGRADFQFFWIKPWQSGHFSKSLNSIGYKIGKRFDLPMIAIFDENGQIIGEWQGAQFKALREIREVIENMPEYK